VQPITEQLSYHSEYFPSILDAQRSAEMYHNEPRTEKRTANINATTTVWPIVIAKDI